MAKKIGTILKYLVFAFILFITCLLIWRMCAYSNTPSGMEALAWNENTAAAYEEHGEAMQILTLNMPDKYRVSPDGMFSVRAVHYIPEAKQLQLTLCYNDSTIEALLEEHPEKKLPEDASLRLTDDKNNYLFGELISTDKKGVYNYARYIFDGVETESALELALEILFAYRSGDIESVHTLSAIAVYHSDIPSTPKKLTKADLSGYEAIK